MTTNEIREGMLRVATANEAQKFMNPSGKNPVCKPGVGTGICVRCGNPWKEAWGMACPSVPPEHRWSVRFPDGSVG